MTDFHVGQKVVYIGDVSSNTIVTRRDVGDMLNRGSVYEVRWIGIFPFAVDNVPDVESKACRLIGVKRNTQGHSDLRDIQYDVPFGQSCFRPVEEIMEEAGIGVKQTVFQKIAQDVTDGKVLEIVE